MVDTKTAAGEEAEKTFKDEVSKRWSTPRPPPAKKQKRPSRTKSPRDCRHQDRRRRRSRKDLQGRSLQEMVDTKTAAGEEAEKTFKDEVSKRWSTPRPPPAKKQ